MRDSKGGPLARALGRAPRVPLAQLPTPLEEAGRLPGGTRLLLKRDDLTGLGGGGNKARKLEHLCAEAVAVGADLLVTVGGEQSNHARMTAAAGARLGIETHLVLGGEPPSTLTGNQLLASLAGAHLHHGGTHDWDLLEALMAERAGEWEAAGRRVFTVPIGGSTPTGARGFAGAWLELLDQLTTCELDPGLVVIASSSGGTHGGLLAGRATSGGPAILAVNVAKTEHELRARAAELGERCLEGLGLPTRIEPADVEVDATYRGEAYGVPTAAGDHAVRWAARSGGWFMDRTYTGKAFAALLARDAAGTLPEQVVFWHTGGSPALFAEDGAPLELASRPPAG
jgi:1-aminocyclopropane-1-carboxylate deaminase/D-cysteine desulfhydrase-like pyridoxal-dependent ACC family enzyme